MGSMKDLLGDTPYVPSNLAVGNLFDTGRATYPDGIPPDVCDLFERLTLEVAASGWNHYSADAILHRIRWHHQIERGNRGFKANNNWTAPLARWFLARHPELSAFFETRGRDIE